MTPPLLSSAFRPFYFLGTLYAVCLTGAWLGAFLGHWEPPSAGMPLRLWHGHFFLLLIAAAIIVGILSYETNDPAYMTVAFIAFLGFMIADKNT